MKEQKVYVAIVTYNRKEYLLNLLEALQQSEKNPVRLFQVVVRRRPLYALATYGLQLHDVFQPQDTGLALRCPGRKRQRERN